MSIQVEWADTDHTILHYHFSQNWTWEEFHAANDRGRMLVSSVEHPVDMIFELEFGMIVPPRVLSNMTRTLRERPPANFNRVVLIGANGLVRNLANVLRTLYPSQMSRVVEAQTVQHALRLLSTQAQISQPA